MIATKGIEQYRCQKCNGPYPLGADDVIATCPYCGFTFVVGGNEMKKHLLVPNKLTNAQAKKAVLKWLEYAASKSVGRGVIKDIVLEEPRLQWIPLFRVEGICDIYYMGGEQFSRGDQKLWRKKEGRFDEVGVEWVLARRYASSFGIQEFIASLDDVTTTEFEMTSTNSAPILNSEIDDRDSLPRAKSRRTDRDRKRLEEEMDKLYDYRLGMDIRFADYVHAPYWLVRYSYQNGTYRVAVSGGTGNVVLGELPITKLYRAKKWITSISMLTLAALIIQALPYITVLILSASDDNEGEIIAIPLVLGLLGIILWLGSYRIIGAVLNYEVCMNADAEERKKHFSLSGIIDDILGRFK